MQVTLHEAEQSLPLLIAAADRGEEAVIARNGKPAVRLVVETGSMPQHPRVLGRLAHLGVRLDGFFDKEFEQEIARDFEDASLVEKPYGKAP